LLSFFEKRGKKRDKGPEASYLKNLKNNPEKAEKSIVLQTCF